MVYEWKIPKYTVPAQSAGEELERIGHKHGILTPHNVLEESRQTQAVLHELFEWNDSSAAEQYRLNQAQEIIGNLVVVRITDDQPREPVRAFVNLVPQENDQERGYLSIVKVLSAPEYTRQMLNTALSELQALRKKYQVLTELTSVFAAIDELEARLRQP